MNCSNVIIEVIYCKNLGQNGIFKFFLLQILPVHCSFIWAVRPLIWAAWSLYDFIVTCRGWISAIKIINFMKCYYIRNICLLIDRLHLNRVTGVQVSWKATDKLVTLYNGSQFWGGRKPECPEKTLRVRLRSTEIQPTCNICSRGGRRDWIVHHASRTSLHV